MSETKGGGVVTENPKQQLVDKIKQSLASGTPFIADYQSLINIADDPKKPLVYVTVEIDTTLDSLAQMPSLVGLPVGNLVPTNMPLLKEVFSSISLQSVSFTLATDTKSISDIQCIIAFGKDDTDATLPITDKFAVSLKTLALTLVTPGGGLPPQLLAGAQGGMQINGKPLDVEVLFPDASLSVKESPLVYITIADFLSLFELDAGSPFADLNVVDLDFYTDLSSKSVSFSANVIYDGGSDQFLPLIPDTLGMSQMGFGFSHDAGVNSGSVSGTLDFKLPTGQATTGLIFAVEADYGSKVWKFSGDIDVAATKQAWKVTDDKGLTLAAISQNMFGIEGSLLPQGLASLYIASCDVSYTTGGSDYSFNGVFGGQWQIFDLDVQTQVSIAISSQTADSKVVKKQCVNCEFIIAVEGYGNNGFEFELGYDFVNKSATAAIPAIGLEGSFADDTVSLTFAETLALEALVEWFVRSATGNPGFAFSPLWSEIFSPFAIPAKTELSIGLKDKSVSCTYPVNKSFFGNTLDSIKIDYDPTKSKDERLQLQLEGDFPGLILSNGEAPEKGKPVAWNPSKPGSEPAVPGLGSKFELDMVALGQHIAFPTPAPKTVEDAVSTLIKALEDEQHIFPKGLEFSDQSGWLIGAKAVFVGQIEAEIIFNDPNIYGLMITVVKPKGKTPSDPKLAAFEGLYFEVLYRKINDAIGEYYVALTLPEKFRKLDFGEVVVQLPSFSLAIYTNGNFKIDLGFPYKADFSKSFVLTYLVFTGQGGFYFGYLSGATADSLPAYNPKLGDFNPVIEFGLGLAVGIQRGFSAGPLSAQVSLLLEAIVQGTYAKYSLIQVPASGPSSDIYYKMQGTVRFVGQLTGKVDLVIITASVLVRLVATAVLVMEAYRKTQAGFSVEVSVAVTVKIGIGFFSIHVHLSFDTTVTESFEFGSNGRGLWEPDSQALEAIMLGGEAGNGFQVGWQPVQFSDKGDTFCQLNTYFVPQLTIAGANEPHYVGMLYLNNPQQPVSGKVDYQDTTPSFGDFASGVLLWVLNACNNGGSTTPISRTDAMAKPVSAADVANMQAFFDQTNDPFTLAQLQAFTSCYYQLKVAPLAEGNGKQADYGLAFFPMLNELQVSYKESDQPAMLMRMESLSVTDDFLEHLSGGMGQGALAQEYLAGFATAKRPVVGESTPLSLDQRMLLDYVLLVIKFGLKETATQMAAAKPPATIGDLLNGLQGKFGGAAGYASRYMLHGIRMAESTSAAALDPLYRLTGQQFPVGGTTADSATIELALAKGADDHWNMSFPSGDALVIESGDGLFKSPKQIAEDMTLDFNPAAGGQVTAGALDIAYTAPKRFGLNMKTDWNMPINGKESTLWSLPTGLMHAIAAGGGKTPFAIYQGSYDSSSGAASEPAALLPAEFSWATQISFTVRRIADASSGTGGKTYLDGIYELAGVDATGLLRLADMLEQQGQSGDISLAFAYAVKNSQGHVTAFQSDTNDTLRWSMVKSNLSTESRPPAQMFLAIAEGAGDTAAIHSFLMQLWEGGITNSGGYYFHYFDGEQGVPANLFDADGKAELMAIVNFANAKEAIAPAAYVNALQTVHPSGENSFFYASADGIEETTATILPGHIGIEVSRPVPPSGGSAAPGKEDYGPSLNHLYNLLTCYISKIGDAEPTAPMRTTGITPLNDSGSTGDASPWVYRKVLPLMPAMVPGGDGKQPPAGLNPYTAVGQEVSFFSAWTDVFGNQAASPSSVVSPILVGYYDPVMGLGQLPHLGSSYSFSSGADSARLEVQFGFNADSYAAYQAEFVQLYAAVAKAMSSLSGEAGAAWQACTTLAKRSTMIADALAGDYGTPGPEAATLQAAQEQLASVEQRLNNDQQCYATFYYQLTRFDDPKKNITAYLASSMLNPIKDAGGNTLPGIDIGTDTLQANAASVYAFFSALTAWLGNDPSKALPAGPTLKPLTLSQGFAPADLVGDYLYVLDVSLVLVRDESYVLEKFRHGEAQTSTSTLLPQYDAQASKDAPLTYIQFATDFAAAFTAKSMQVATGAAWEAGQAAQGKQFWVLRYGKNGISVSADTSSPAEYYAPRPLSNQLLSQKDVAIQAFDTTTGILKPGTPFTVSDVDLDALMGRFLLAVERFLTPESAVAASIANSGAFADILTAKRDIAENLCQTMTNLTSGKSYSDPSSATPAMAAAVEKLKQECLVSLTNFYEMDAVISQALKGSCQGGGKPPRLNLFGSPTDSSATAQPDSNFSLSTGKAPINDGASYLAYSLKSKRKGMDGQFNAPLQFDVGAIEHDMQTISDGAIDYTSGAWVRLLLAPQPIQLGDIDFQIPLRAYPMPPSLLGQDYASVLDEGSVSGLSGQSGTLIDKAKEWAFDVVYGHRYVAQDTIYNRTTLNIGLQGGPEMLFAESGKTLLEALTDFDQNIAPIERFMAENLKQALGGQPAPSNLINAVASFASLVQEVAASDWGLTSGPETEMLLQSSGLQPYQSQYMVSEGVPNPATGKDDGIFYVEVARGSQEAGYQKIAPLPEVCIEGLTTDKVGSEAEPAYYRFLDAQKKPLTKLAAAAYTERTLKLQPLNIIDRQNGRAEIKVVRNQGLPAAFVYETPYVSYPEIVTPHLDLSTAIDFSAVGGGTSGQNLPTHLQDLFNVLLTGTDDKVSEQSGSFRIVGYYQYPLAGDAGTGAHSLPQIEVPVLFSLPMPLPFDPSNPDVQAYIKNAGNRMQAWVTNNRPAHLAAGANGSGSFRFDITIFTELSKSGEPILRLRNLYLPVDSVKPD